MLRGIWKLLRDRPELGRLTPYDDELEARLRTQLGGDIKGATMSAALRILERHGMLRRDDERLAATRPEPGRIRRSMSSRWRGAPEHDAEQHGAWRTAANAKLVSVRDTAAYQKVSLIRTIQMSGCILSPTRAHGDLL